jgi:hypothetical protein
VWTEAEVAEVRANAAELHRRLFEKQAAEKPDPWYPPPFDGMEPYPAEKPEVP